MKMKALFSSLMFLSAFVATAQINFESPADYPKLYDVSYDAIIQNKIYAVTLNNHIVVSNDKGINWQVLYTHTNQINQMKMVNDGTGLTLAARDGIILYDLQSNQLSGFAPIPDSGVTGASANTIYSYAAYDQNTFIVQTFFAVGIEKQTKVFYTTNAGEDWDEIYYSVDHDNVFPETVAISPNDPQKLFILRGNGSLGINGGIWISANGGETFTETLEGVVLSAIDINPGNPDEILIGTGISFGVVPEGIYKSLDGGMTWDQVAIEWNAGILNNVKHIRYNPTNPDMVIVLEENEIVSSIDGGLTWNDVNYETNSLDYNYGLNASYDPFNDTNIIITTVFYPQLTEDNGATLTKINAPYFTATNVSVDKVSESTHVFYSSNGGFIHKDIEENESTAHQFLPPTQVSQANIIVVPDPLVAGRSFILNTGGFTEGSLSVTYDNGASATWLMGLFSDELQQVTVDPVNNNIIYFSARQFESSTLYKVDMTNPENVTSETITTPGDGVITGIIVSSSTGEIIIAKVNKLYVSTDGGANWTEMDTIGLNTATFNIIWDMEQSFVNENNIMLSTDSGVFTSTDGGTTWIKIIENGNVRKVSYSNSNANVAAVAVYTGLLVQASFMVTSDNGGNWITVTPEDLLLASCSSVDFAYGEDTVTAYLATSDLGIVSYVVDLGNLGTDIPELSPNTLMLYPNPASDFVKVAVDENNVIVSTIIYSISGQKILESANTEINISGLSNGIYMVKSITARGGNYFQKLIKQ